MPYSPRPRRFRRTAAARITAAGLVTARDILTAVGIPAAMAERFSGAVTTALKDSGIAPAAITWTKRNGRARDTAAFRVAAGLLAALLVYRPGGKPTVLKSGKPSRSKKELARQKLVAEWTRNLFGRTTPAPTATVIHLVPAQHTPDSIPEDLITCTQCGLVSAFADDANDGAWAAHDAGWHVLGLSRDECGCPILCRDCADAWCGIADTTPRLVGMRAA